MTDRSKPSDHMADLGVLALVSRLRRLSDRLWEDTASLYSELGIDFRPRWFSVFSAIGRSHHPSISELAAIVGLTTQGVGKIVDELFAAGLLHEVSDPSDSRVRRVRLSTAGLSMQSRLKPVWSGIQSVTRDLMTEAGVDLVADLDRIEASLSVRSHGERFRKHFNLATPSDLEIVPYRPEYKKHFRALNEEWLTADFSIEEHDARILADPNGLILRRGGHILFALVRGEVVGTCALIRHRSGETELAKMAVAPRSQNRGVGTALATAVVRLALEAGAQTVWLRTHLRPKAARRMYSKIGFRRVTKSPLPPPPVVRDSITMRLNITAYQKYLTTQE